MLEAMGAQLILGAQQILMVLGAQGAQGAQTMNCTKATVFFAIYYSTIFLLNRIGNPMIFLFAQIIVDVPAQTLQFFLLNVKMMIISFQFLNGFSPQS